MSCSPCSTGDHSMHRLNSRWNTCSVIVLATSILTFPIIAFWF